MLKPISSEALREFAGNAQRLAGIIRQWLPVAGAAEAKTANWRTAERWFYRAADHYTACERIRNPHKRPFEHRGGSYFGPSSCSPPWFELATALDEIAIEYRLQGVSDESGIPHLPFEQDVPAIDVRTLKRLEQAASEILESVRDEQAENPDLTDALKPGPEWAERSDVRERYFAVWAFCQKPGNSGLTPNAITTKLKISKPKLKISKAVVYQVLNETRPPTAEEIEEHRKQVNKR